MPQLNVFRRKDSFPHPTSKQFRPEAWQELLEGSDPVLGECARIALMVWDVLEGIRATSRSTYERLPKCRDERVAGFINLLNCAGVEVAARGENSFDPADNPVANSLHSRIDNLSPNGPVSIDEALAAIIDGARFSLYELTNESDDSFGGGDTSQSDEALMIHFHAGQEYNAWSNLWSEFALGRLMPDGTGQLNYVDERRVVHTVIAEHRSRRRLVTAIPQIAQAWPRVPDAIRRRFRGSNIKIDQKTGLIRFRPAAELPEDVPTQFLLAYQADSEIGRTAILSKLPAIAGLSASQMLQVWRAIASAIAPRFTALVDTYRRSAMGPDDWQALSSQSSFRFSRIQLIADVSGYTGLSKGAVAQAIAALIWKSGTVSSLWGSPLLSVAEDELVALAVPFTSGAYLYPLRDWFKRGQADISKKGISFERELQVAVDSGIADQTSLGHWRCLYGQTVECAARNEEIDLLLATGDAVFVVEAKSFLPGYEPRELEEYYAKVRSAIAQAKRKATNVSASRDRLRALLARKGWTELDWFRTCRILPLVITYHPLGVGWGDEDCAVIDMITLTRFLGNELPTWTVFGQGEAISGPKTPMYQSSQQADRQFTEYVRNPPIIERYLSQVVPRRIQFLRAGKQEPGFEINYFEVAPDSEEARYFKEFSEQIEGV